MTPTSKFADHVLVAISAPEDKKDAGGKVLSYDVEMVHHATHHLVLKSDRTVKSYEYRLMNQAQKPASEVSLELLDTPRDAAGPHLAFHATVSDNVMNRKGRLIYVGNNESYTVVLQHQGKSAHTRRSKGQPQTWIDGWRADVDMVNGRVKRTRYEDCNACLSVSDMQKHLNLPLWFKAPSGHRRRGPADAYDRGGYVRADVGGGGGGYDRDGNGGGGGDENCVANGAVKGGLFSLAICALTAGVGCPAAAAMAAAQGAAASCTVTAVSNVYGKDAGDAVDKLHSAYGTAQTVATVAGALGR